MVILFCEGQEFIRRNERQVWIWQRVDMDGDLCGYQAHDLVACGVLRNTDTQCDWQPGWGPYLDKLCGEDELTDTDGYEAVHEIDECSFQEGGESPARAEPLFHVL